MSVTYVPVPAKVDTKNALVISGSIDGKPFSTMFYVQQVAVSGGGKYLAIDGGRIKNVVASPSTVTVGGIYKLRSTMLMFASLQDVTQMTCTIAGKQLKHSFLSSMSISRMSEETISLYTAFKGSMSISGFTK